MHKTSVAAMAIGVPASTMKNWLKAGVAPAFTQAEPRRMRMFSFRCLVAAGLMREMMAAGVPMEWAAGLAKSGVARLGDDHIEDDAVKVYFWRAGPEWRGGFLEPDVSTCGHVRVGGVTAGIRQRLGEPLQRTSGTMAPDIVIPALLAKDLRPDDRAALESMRRAIITPGDLSLLAMIAGRYGYAG